jgi:hypothetical protein
VQRQAVLPHGATSFAERSCGLCVATPIRGEQPKAASGRAPYQEKSTHGRHSAGHRRDVFDVLAKMCQSHESSILVVERVRPVKAGRQCFLEEQPATSCKEPQGLTVGKFGTEFGRVAHR